MCELGFEEETTPKKHPLSRFNAVEKYCSQAPVVELRSNYSYYILYTAHSRITQHINHNILVKANVKSKSIFSDLKM